MKWYDDWLQIVNSDLNHTETIENFLRNHDLIFPNDPRVTAAHRGINHRFMLNGKVLIHCEIFMKSIRHSSITYHPGDCVIHNIAHKKEGLDNVLKSVTNFLSYLSKKKNTTPNYLLEADSIFFRSQSENTFVYMSIPVGHRIGLKIANRLGMSFFSFANKTSGIDNIIYRRKRFYANEAF